MKSDSEVIVMVREDNGFWSETVLSQADFLRKKANWQAMTVEDFERMVAADPNVEVVTQEIAERFGFTEDALDFHSARLGAFEDNENR